MTLVLIQKWGFESQVKSQHILRVLYGCTDSGGLKLTVVSCIAVKIEMSVISQPVQHLLTQCSFTW